MYQKIIVPIDHGNRNLKTEQHVFTSGILESDCKPVLGEFLQYNGRYYTLSEQRIPYMRDKSSDERFFILTLFGIVMEAEHQRINAENTILPVELPVGCRRSITGRCIKSSGIILWTGEGSVLFIREGNTRWRLQMRLSFRRIMRRQ